MSMLSRHPGEGRDLRTRGHGRVSAGTPAFAGVTACGGRHDHRPRLRPVQHRADRQNSLDRFGERFEQRVFTDVERAKAARRPFTRAGTYAKRFAAKEAFSKAVGTGFKRGVFMKDIGVVNLPSGAADAAR